MIEKNDVFEIVGIIIDNEMGRNEAFELVEKNLTPSLENLEKISVLIKELHELTKNSNDKISIISNKLFDLF